MKLSLLALALGASLTTSASAQISTFCTAQNNSSGAPAALAMSGSVNVTDNGLTFAISSLPSFNYNMAQRGTFGVLLASRSFNTTGTMPAGSMGTLCLTSFFFDSTAIIAGDMSGSAAGAIDLTNLPSGLGSVMPGDTVAFQAWYRDVDNSMGMLNTTSNFTNAVQVDFEPPPPSFANQIVPLFGPSAQGGNNCTGCHGGASPFGNLDLTGTPSDIHSRLVNVTSALTGCSFEERVKPFDSDESSLYRLVSNTDGCATTPFASNMRISDSAEVALIKEWIDAGAPNN